MRYYIYCADVYCPDCIVGMKHDADLAYAMGEIPDYLMRDSNHYPQGPFDHEESDTPTHCGGCGVFLEQPLTQDGYQYIIDKMNHSGPLSDVEKVWFHFYGNDSVLYDPAPHATQQYRTVKDIIWRSFDSELYD